MVQRTRHPDPAPVPVRDSEFNVVADQADALYTPFVEAPGSIVNANTHEFLQRPTLSPTDDPRSLVSFTAVAGGLTPGSWLIPTGTYVVLPEIVGSIGLTCAQTTRVPLTANFGTNVSPYATSPALPVRAFATVTIWTLNPNDLSTSPSVQQCDPALYQSTQYASTCSTQNWCPAYFLQIGYIDPTYSPSTSYVLSPLESSCIASAIWSEIPGTSTNFQAMGDMLIELECSNTKALQQNTATVLANAIQFPSLDCANAVDRMVDVGWWVRYAVSLGYQLQCGSQPIGPYDYVIGTAFGLMYNQIPDLQFPLDYRYWTAAHYNITASVLNYLRTYDATGTPLDDQILTEALLDEYLLSLAPTLPNATSVAAIPIAPLIVDGPSYIVPGQTPTTVVRLSEAGPPYDTWLAFHSMRVPWIAWDVVILRPQIYYNFAGDPSPETASAFQNAVWSAWALQTGKGSPQDGYTQAEFGGRVVAMLQAFPTMALPGVWQSAPGFLANSGTLVTVTHVANLSAFEMWRSDGTRCGVAYNVVAGQNTTMVCSGSFNTSAVAQLAQYMQALYNSIGGPAGSALNGSANAALNSTGFVFSETATDDWEGVHFRSVPYDSMFTIAGNGSSVDWNNAYSAFVTQFMQMAASVERTAPYTIPAANMFYQIFEEPPQDALDALTESIVVNHQWPYNKLVANAQAQAVAAGGFTLPFNISDYSDQIALKNSYYTLWPPSKCTADKQCQSFSRNGYTKCVYDESTIPYRPYRNGDPSWSAVLSLGDEGGCRARARSAKVSGTRSSSTFSRSRGTAHPAPRTGSRPSTGRTRCTRSSHSTPRPFCSTPPQNPLRLSWLWRATICWMRSTPPWARRSRGTTTPTRGFAAAAAPWRSRSTRRSSSSWAFRSKTPRSCGRPRAPRSRSRASSSHSSSNSRARPTTLFTLEATTRSPSWRARPTSRLQRKTSRAPRERSRAPPVPPAQTAPWTLALAHSL